MPLKTFDAKNFDKEVLESKLPVVIDFWAAWCGPCRMFSPIIEEVSESKEYQGKITFGKVNTDENSGIAARYNIMSIPTAMLIKNGEVKAISIGVISKDALKKWINSNI
jgi:thioredoxin 1